MGNCISTKDQWIAKETFHPSEDMKETEDMKLLKITKDDRLRMIDDQVVRVVNRSQSYQTFFTHHS